MLKYFQPHKSIFLITHLLSMNWTSQYYFKLSNGYSGTSLSSAWIRERLASIFLILNTWTNANTFYFFMADIWWSTAQFGNYKMSWVSIIDSVIQFLLHSSIIDYHAQFLVLFAKFGEIGKIGKFDNYLVTFMQVIN